jgi:membrane protease YdiL (CAAX protease family)
MANRLRTVVRHPGERPSLSASIALAAGAPLAVVAALELTGNVLLTFLVYHFLVCVAVPAILSRRRGLDLQAHLKWLGWRDPSNEWAGPVGVGVGVATALLGFGFVGTVGLRIVDPATLRSILSTWGIPPSAIPFLFLYMVLVNSVTEELFWRGALQTRLEVVESRKLALAGASAAFASYHAYTVLVLTGSLALGLGLAVAVFAGGLLWAGLREAFDSVKPAVWAHVGASAGYMTAFVVWFA